MIIFISIALAAFLIEAGAFLFDHDTDLGHDGEAGHPADSAGDDPSVSIFSIKVMATLFLGFGAAGAIAMHYGIGWAGASLLGLGCGLVLSALMYLLLKLLYSQQASSLVSTRAAVGCVGDVIVTIGDNAPGEIGLYLDGQYRTFSATSSDGKAVPKGKKVLVLNNLGSHLIVERDFPA